MKYLFIAIWALLLFSGCSTKYISNYCQIYEPIRYNVESINDVDVIKTIDGNNAYYYELCIEK